MPIVTSVNCEQPSHPKPPDVTESGIVSDVSFELLNAPGPIKVTVSGISMLVMFVPANACCAMVCRLEPSANVTLSSAVPIKASEPREVTPSPTTTEVAEVYPPLPADPVPEIVKTLFSSS